MWRKKDASRLEATKRAAVPQVMAQIESGTAALRILIADDHAVTRGMLREMLEAQTGWVVCGEAGNGREAIELARKLQPDLITLDLSMPVMNGVQAAQELKKLMPTVPLVVITMFKTPHLEQEALNAGASMVLAKSEPGQIVNKIRGLFESTG